MFVRDTAQQHVRARLQIDGGDSLFSRSYAIGAAPALRPTRQAGRIVRHRGDEVGRRLVGWQLDELNLMKILPPIDELNASHSSRDAVWAAELIIVRDERDQPGFGDRSIPQGRHNFTSTEGKS